MNSCLACGLASDTHIHTLTHTDHLPLTLVAPNDKSNTKYEDTTKRKYPANHKTKTEAKAQPKRKSAANPYSNKSQTHKGHKKGKQFANHRMQQIEKHVFCDLLHVCSFLFLHLFVYFVFVLSYLYMLCL